MGEPLEGLRVLDLSWVLSGPFATMILADLGAEVIKVERPQGGDIARGTGPFIDGESSYFLSINRGKKSVVLDLNTPGGREILLKLAAQVDVLVENFSPGIMKRWGLDYEVVSQYNHRIIYASISGFGQSGPYADRPALDVIVQGMGGIMSITGEPEGPPIRPGVSLGDIAASLFAAIGILAALHERNISGKGQMLDISMLDCQVALLENAFARFFATGEVPQPLGTRHPVTTPFQAFATKDGYITVAVVGESQWALFCSALDRVDLIDHEGLQTGWSRTQYYGELEPILKEAMAKKTTAEWLEQLSALGVPCGPINSIDQVAQDQQVLYRQMIIGLSHRRVGKVKVVNTPVKLSRTPASVERSCPDLGEHTKEVLSRLLGMTEREIDNLT